MIDDMHSKGTFFSTLYFCSLIAMFFSFSISISLSLSLYLSIYLFFSLYFSLSLSFKGIMRAGRRNFFLHPSWHHDLILHEAGVPPIHTPISELEKLDPDVKTRYEKRKGKGRKLLWVNRVKAKRE
jgi:hypothetical protein